MQSSQLPATQRPASPTMIQAMLGVSLVTAAGEIKGPSGGPCLDFIASTGAVDRYREIIEPEGWRLESYRRNPVFQNAHRYGDVLFTLGKALVTEVRDLADGRKGLFQRIEFATEVNPVARIAYGLYRGGFLSAVSVGFIPLRWEEGTDKTPFSRRYLEQELLEVSAVAIPANSEALALGLAAGAVTRSAVQEALELLAATLNATPGRDGSPSRPSGPGRAGGRPPGPPSRPSTDQLIGDLHGRLGEPSLPAQATSDPSAINHQPSTLNPQQLWSFARQLRAAMRN